jgi:putative tryptophan/tyrosine transport system substrate-binding protein
VRPGVAEDSGANLERRRDFIGGIGAVAATPLAAQGQRSATAVIGLLMIGSPAPNGAPPAFGPAFRAGLRDLGFVEGQNISIEYRYGRNDLSRLPELVADLIRRQVAVIATLGGPAPAQAAMAATKATPIIFETGSDPVQAGLVASLNRPGGNATGVAFMIPELRLKQISLLHDLLPKAMHFAVLLNSSETTAVSRLQSEASTIAVQIEPFSASNNGEIDVAFANLSEWRVDALLVSQSQLFSDRKVQIATLAARYMMPTMFTDLSFPTSGGLMSYGPSYPALVRQVGVYVGRILKGEKPADLPVIRPTKFNLVINLQTAKTLGLQIPDNLLALADFVIE